MKFIPALLLIPALAFGALAQEAPKLTEADNLKLRAAQVEFLQAQAAYAPLQEAALKQLQASKEGVRLAAAQDELQKAVVAVYDLHKLKPTEYQICDGPGQDKDSPCKGVPDKELAFRAVPKTEAKK